MILITGATGTNGKEIVKLLRSLGQPVRALVRNPAKAEDLKALGAEIVQGEFDQFESLSSALQGVTKALMLPPFDERMVQLQQQFIQAAQQAGSVHVVKFSALGSAPDSPMLLGRWHGEGEKLLAASGLPFTILRPNGFMQNLFQLAGTIAGQGVFYQPAGDARISHVDVRDIAAVAAAVLTEDGHAGKLYEITGPEAVTFTQVAEALSAALGKPITYVDVSPQDFKQSLLGWGQPEWAVDALNELYAFYKQGGGSLVTNVVETVGKKQPTTIEQFARDFVQVFQSS